MEDKKVRLYFPTGEEYNIGLMVGSQYVGKINHNNLLPQGLLDSVTDVEYGKLKSIEDSQKTNHLNYITISKEYRRKGYFQNAVMLFEKWSLIRGFESVTLLCKDHLIPAYKSMGYEIQFKVESTGYNFLKKELEYPTFTIAGNITNKKEGALL